MIDGLFDWILDQGSLVVAFSVGVISTHWFTSKVFQERVQSMLENIEYLRKELETSDKRCEARVEKLEERYISELEAIRAVNESNERRFAATLKMIGDIKVDFMQNNK